MGGMRLAAAATACALMAAVPAAGMCYGALRGRWAWPTPDAQTLQLRAIRLAAGLWVAGARAGEERGRAAPPIEAGLAGAGYLRDGWLSKSGGLVSAYGTEVRLREVRGGRARVLTGFVVTLHGLPGEACRALAAGAAGLGASRVRVAGADRGPAAGAAGPGPCEGGGAVEAEFDA